MAELKGNIRILDRTPKVHTKASEKYLSVKFSYPEFSQSWSGWVPIEYRRTGVSIQNDDELYEHLNYVYDQMNPSNYKGWLAEQQKFWATEKSGAAVTKPFFDALAEGGWKCSSCSLPQNRNFARRIQDLKEMGYTIATDTKRYCPHCGSNTTHLMLLPIKRGSSEGNGYETWSPSLRKRIIKVLGSIDIYENTFNANVLPDHKFSEIRWDENVKSENSDLMSDAEIRAKFQLLTNQRNQQKREVCRTCFQTGKRGTAFGIPFFYKGGEDWDESIPKKGTEAEKGCIGCPWYDFEKWREELKKKLNI